LLVVGLVLLLFGASKVRQFNAAAKWVPHTATVLSVSERYEDVPEKYGHTRYAFPEVEYKYEYAGKPYQSTMVSFEKQSVWIPVPVNREMKNAERNVFWKNWGAGSEINIYIDPNDRSQSVIINKPTSRRRSHHLALIVSGVILVAIGLLLIIVA
jgi:hypothetical protein